MSHYQQRPSSRAKSPAPASAHRSTSSSHPGRYLTLLESVDYIDHAAESTSGVNSNSTASHSQWTNLAPRLGASNVYKTGFHASPVEPEVLGNLGRYSVPSIPIGTHHMTRYIPLHPPLRLIDREDEKAPAATGVLHPFEAGIGGLMIMKTIRGVRMAWSRDGTINIPLRIQWEIEALEKTGRLGSELIHQWGYWVDPTTIKPLGQGQAQPRAGRVTILPGHSHGPGSGNGGQGVGEVYISITKEPGVTLREYAPYAELRNEEERAQFLKRLKWIVAVRIVRYAKEDGVFHGPNVPPRFVETGELEVRFSDWGWVRKVTDRRDVVDASDPWLVPRAMVVGKAAVPSGQTSKRIRKSDPDYEHGLLMGMAEEEVHASEVTQYVKEYVDAVFETAWKLKGRYKGGVEDWKHPWMLRSPTTSFYMAHWLILWTSLLYNDRLSTTFAIPVGSVNGVPQQSAWYSHGHYGAGGASANSAPVIPVIPGEIDSRPGSPSTLAAHENVNEQCTLRENLQYDPHSRKLVPSDIHFLPEPDFVALYEPFLPLYKDPSRPAAVRDFPKGVQHKTRYVCEKQMTSIDREDEIGLAATGMLCSKSSSGFNGSGMMKIIRNVRLIWDTRTMLLPPRIQWEIEALKKTGRLQSFIHQWGYWYDPATKKAVEGRPGTMAAIAEIYISINREEGYTLRDYPGYTQLTDQKKREEFLQDLKDLVVRRIVEYATKDGIFHGGLNLGNIHIIQRMNKIERHRAPPIFKPSHLEVRFSDWGYTRQVVQGVQYPEHCNDRWLVPAFMVLRDPVSGRMPQYVVDYVDEVFKYAFKLTSRSDGGVISWKHPW
ncbi:hypothetical protein CVT24_000681 [Panaeolus cyanescens]|uniref:Protein kinase domain-containing protein n=1 Tax=Panaeolus cyanescens TaxID=181874 RepID=A0A409VWL1_9AGAR|nr:hypothetical protein CVT24_000681 [Panaeolus cyanescens]